MVIQVNGNATIRIDGDVTVEGFEEESKKMLTLADVMEADLGAKEWGTIVSNIQIWYYGKMVKAAWCCTSLSYYAHKLGLDQQIPKNENVDRLKDFMVSKGKLDCTKLYGGGAYKAKRGDVVFFSSKHDFKDCTHVGVVTGIDHATGNMNYVSGNANDMIMCKSTNYLKDYYVVAFGRVDYA